MKHHALSWLYRILLMAALVVPGIALPQSAQAAAPAITITATKTDESVSIHTSGLVAGMSYTARMGPIGSKGVNGTAVGDTTAASDGTFDATYTIPDSLRGQATIAIRIDGSNGFFAYNWFTNKTNGSAPSATATPAPGVTTTPLPTGNSGRMSIQVTSVVQNDKITVSAFGFPANVDFTVRIGPYYTFWRNQAQVGVTNSGSGGNFQFDANLPDVVKDVALVTIRLDAYSGGNHYVTYNAFTNVSGGTGGPVSPTATPGSNSPTATPVPGNPTAIPTTVPSSPNTGLPIVQSGCKITSITPTRTLPTNYDYDAVWTVTNTGTVDWDNHAVDYFYSSGQKMGKTTTPYDLPKRVKPGETVDLSADMLAPGDKGTYTTTWVLHGDRGNLCTLPLTIVVK
jgi:hypothetical protein